MAKKLSFKEFEKAIEDPFISAGRLRDYVKDYAQLNSDSPIPKLSFRADALTNQLPAGYDLDKRISQRLRYLEKQDRSPHVVAEGDSWFKLPPLFWPYAIPDKITQNGKFSMVNNAQWDYTLKEILENRNRKGDEDAPGYEGEKGCLTVLREEDPEYFLLSAGGNDLQELLKSGDLLRPYDPKTPNRPLNKYLKKKGKNALRDIGRGYKKLLSKVTKEFPDLKVLTYGYDYPRPLVGGGCYIGQYLRELPIPAEKMTPIMKDVLDEFNKSIEATVKELNSDNVRYLDCRGVTKDCTWDDDMHPSSDGFEALAKKFEETMNDWSKEGK